MMNSSFAHIFYFIVSGASRYTPGYSIRLPGVHIKMKVSKVKILRARVTICEAEY